MNRFLQIVVLAIVCSMAQAQNTSNSAKIINLVSGGTPGGKDVILRPVTAQIEKNNPNVRFVYEFKPGAGELVAYNYVSKLNHLSNSIFVTSVNLFTYVDIWNSRDITVQPMDMVFGPIIAQSPGSIVTAPNSMINSLDDLVTQLRTNHNNIGGMFTTKLYQEYIIDKLGIDRNKLQFIPYRGSPDAALAAASGQVQFASVPSYASYRLHQAGKLKIIAIAGTQRLEKLPEVPLLRDAIPGATFSQATVLVYPPGTTIEQVKFYQELFAPALNDPDVKKHLNELLASVTPHLIDSVAARAYVQRLRDKWQPYAKRIQPE